MKSTTISFILISSLFLFGLSSCDKVECDHITNPCVDQLLEAFNMKSYNDEDLECHSYLSLFEYNNKFYATLDNGCVAPIGYIIYECSGDVFCFQSTSDPCNSFFNSVSYMGIVGIEK